MRKKIQERRWFYPLVYLILFIISSLPPITERPYVYDQQGSMDVLMQILMISITPYQQWGWIFHIATLGLVVWVVMQPQHAGRVMAAYFGINYLVIAALQTNAVTEQYGFAIQTGAMIAAVLLGILWLGVAYRNKLQASFQDVPSWRWLLLPFALLVFWSPIAIEGSKVIANFDPLLLLTSPDYGLAYCFMTPVFLFFLVLFYPKVDGFAFRVTAFNGLLYGLYNLIHWFNPDTVWMGVMHIPLLVLPITALWMVRGTLGRTALAALA
jgi:hypothetical protein